MAETLHGLEWKLKCLACMVSITHVKALKQVASYGISHEPPWLKQEKAKPSMLSNSPIFLSAKPFAISKFSPNKHY